MSDSLPNAGAGPDAAPAPPDPDAGTVDPHLRAAILEIEAHAAEAGWDQAARLFALVPTSDLLAREPGLAEALGVAAASAGALTPVEQDSLPPDRALEDVLDGIMWPAEVFGCAAVVERLVLPPSADDAMPEDAVAAQEYAAAHPDRQEVRLVAAVTRDGATYCTLRMRAHDDDASVLEGTDLVPGLLELLHGTLEQ
jgi:hypothetical protein